MENDTIIPGHTSMQHLTYRILLRKEPEGGFTVIVPALPGCVTYGETMDEAVDMAKEAIELYVESLEAHKEPVPSDAQMFEYTVVLERNT